MHTLKSMQRRVAGLLVAAMLLPTLAFTAGCGSKDTASDTSGGGTTATASQPQNTMTPAATSPMAPVHHGLSTKQKVVILAGAALLYYLYKKHQAAKQADQAGAAGATSQLYRSQNGGIYYRNAQHKAVWVTAPSQGIAVPADQVQQYAPDYQRYTGPAPAAPDGEQTISADQYDPALAGR